MHNRRKQTRGLQRESGPKRKGSAETHGLWIGASEETTLFRRLDFGSQHSPNLCRTTPANTKSTQSRMESHIFTCGEGIVLVKPSR
mmetsp:Transcript_10916/g.24839  ORF Transcript_10916/g.24839 Transcript_10916/m.24839 type:complete len:86 (+) Transcript_10916:145-402(+)